MTGRMTRRRPAVIRAIDNIHTVTADRYAVDVSAGPFAIRSTTRVVKLPVIYVGGNLPVTYRPLPARMVHRALVLKGVGQSLGLMTVIITR